MDQFGKKKLGKKKKIKSGSARKASPPQIETDTAQTLWAGPIHETRFLRQPLNVAALKHDAVRLSIELGPDHVRVRTIRKQIADIEEGIVKR